MTQESLLKTVRELIELHPGLTLMQLETLLVLMRESPKPVHLMQLTRECVMTPGAMARVLRTFRDDLGWVTIEIDPEDERHKIIRLTPKGTRLIDRLFQK